MNDINNLFFDLIRVSLGTQETLSRPPSKEEWKELYNMAKKQSLVGICFAGVQRLQSKDYPEPNSGYRLSVMDSGLKKSDQASITPNQEPTTPNQEPNTYNPQPDSTNNQESLTKNLNEVQYLKWMGMAAKIQQRNEVMDGYTEEVNRYFDGIGVPSMILKGQAIGTLYGELRNLRQSGDVDVWVKMSRKDLFDWSQKKFGQVEGYNGFHIHSPFFKDAEVEVHFIPGYFSSPICNRRFKRFCKMHEPRLNDGSINLPFNLVYILQHCYNHLCGHGVGLRQVMDYYFVLVASHDENARKLSASLSVNTSSKANTNLANGEENIIHENLRGIHGKSRYKEDAMYWIERMGMRKFCTAVMWVMQEVFGMPGDLLLCKSDEKLGRFLLNEIQMTGNMGHHDERVKAGTWSTAWGRYRYKLKRVCYLASICPQEVLWRPWMSLISYVKIKFQK